MDSSTNTTTPLSKLQAPLLSINPDNAVSGSTTTTTAPATSSAKPADTMSHMTYVPVENLPQSADDKREPQMASATSTTTERRPEIRLLSTMQNDNDQSNENGGDYHDAYNDTPSTTTSGDAWYQNPHQITAMLSNYSTSYNVVNISLVLPILKQILLQQQQQQNSYSGTASSATNQSACASSLLAGMIIGQLVGGALGDSFLGRLGALRLVMTLQVLASLASAILPSLPPSQQEESTLTWTDQNNDVSDGDDDHAFGNSLYMTLAMCRFVLGVGAGGVYPLAAVLSAEQGKSRQTDHNNNNDINSQVQRVVLTFSTQGLGFVTVPLVAVPLLYASIDLDLVWRILLGLGSVPGILLLVMQWRYYYSASNPFSHNRIDPVLLEEPPMVDDLPPPQPLTQSSTAIDTKSRDAEALATTDSNYPSLEDAHDDNERDGILRATSEDPLSNVRLGWWESIRQEPGLLGKVIGTAGTWCLFDVLFYGNTLFQPIVVEAAFGPAHSQSAIRLLQKTALDSLILTSIALPGYAVAGILMGKQTGCVNQTPRYVMLQGFAAMAVLYSTIGWNWSYLRHYPGLLVTLYGLTFFFANYGPNTSTFILPSLLYSPECRSTWNGISAAFGKLGALCGATLFAPAAAAWGDSRVMLICAGVSVVAYLITWFFVQMPQQEGDNNENDRDNHNQDGEYQDNVVDPLPMAASGELS